MNTKTTMAIVLIVSMFVIGCTSSSQSGYATYNQPQQGQPSGQYVGGGCGVAPAGDYMATPVDKLGIASPVL